MIASNTAKSAAYYSGEGRYMAKNLYEIANHIPAENEKTGQQVVEDVAQRMGLEVRKNGTV